MRSFIERYTSRKLLIAIATVILIVVNESLSAPIPEETYWAIIMPVVAFIVGESYIDGKAVVLKKPKDE